MTIDLDLQNMLCLACFSSVLSKDRALHVTNCCNQVICDSCIQANPRFATYDPCLVCLGGVCATRGKDRAQNTRPKVVNSSMSQPHTTNISDGETIFTLGDDSDGDAEEQEISPQKAKMTSLSPLPPPPGYQQATNFPTSDSPRSSTPLPSPPDVVSFTPSSPTLHESASRRYYIDPRDTVHGIALRFGIDARELCRHNKLPFSTLSTTPHLLHTRVFLELLPSSRPVPLRYVLSEEDQAERDARRTKERAQKRLQMVTKEVDWQVAKAYVALADDPEVTEELAGKQKEGYGSVRSRVGPPGASLESRAVDMYLEDEEWEQEQSSTSRTPQISPFPLSQRHTKDASNAVVKGKWWPWKS